MNLLTDDDVKKVFYGFSWFSSQDVSFENANDFAKEIEAAVLAKIAAMDLPEPAEVAEDIFAYTEDQLRQAFAQGAASQIVKNG